MSLEKFIAEAKGALAQVDSLKKPIKDLPKSHWQKQLQAKASENSELGSLGSAKLTGDISATVHLTKTADPPLDLAKFEGDKDWKTTAFASFVISAQAGADLETSEPVTGGSFGAGIEAGVGVALAHHRPYKQSRSAVAALTGLAGDLAVPYDLERVVGIGEHDILQAQFSGSAVVRAFAGWEYGLVQEISGSNLGNFAPDTTTEIVAGAKLGATFKAGLKGELRVIVSDVRQNDAGHDVVRLQLHKSRNTFVGAGLELTAGLDLGDNADKFIDSIIDQVLDLPDGLVDDLEELQNEIKALQKKVDDLSAAAKADIANAAEKAAAALKIADIQKLLARFDEQKLPVQNILERFRPGVVSVLDKFEEGQADLDNAVDKLSASAKGSLDQASTKIGAWISAYEDLRKKSRDYIVDHAQEGIKVEMEAGINRTRARQALLDLEFDIHLASDAYLAAVKGNFAPALEKAAPKNGSSGVELKGGSLKETATAERFFNLGVNFFGLDVERSLENWKKVTVKTDLGDGRMWIVGEAGASLMGKFGDRVRTLSFLFDLSGAVEKVDGKLYLTDPKVAYRARLKRTATFAKGDKIERLLPLHLESAQAVGGIGPDESQALETAILEATGPYSYDLEVAFTPAAIRKVFLFDEPGLSKKDLHRRFWDTFRKAASLLDMAIPASGNKTCAFSNLLTEDAIKEVEQGNSNSWKTFRATPPQGFKLASGAHRMVWFYIWQASTFYHAYRKARQSLLAGKPVTKVAGNLRIMAKKATAPQGALSTRPLDAKYLTLALLADPSLRSTSVTFKRGDKVSVRF